MARHISHNVLRVIESVCLVSIFIKDAESWHGRHGLLLSQWLVSLLISLGDSSATIFNSCARPDEDMDVACGMGHETMSNRL